MRTCGGNSIVLDRIVEAKRHDAAKDDAAAGIPAGTINIVLSVFSQSKTLASRFSLSVDVFDTVVPLQQWHYRNDCLGTEVLLIDLFEFFCFFSRRVVC